MKKYLQKISIPIGLTFKLLLLSILGIVTLYLLYVLIDKAFLNPPVSAIVPIEKRRTVSDVYIQINIINATGMQGLAKKAMNYFRDRGFDVVEISTSDSLERTSYVIDHLSDTISARSVAFALGLTDSSVRHDYDTNLYLRASVVLGKNYHTLKPFKQ
ncbi:MAG: LytR family transcriptional regulator [Ignavibacteria bacterium]|nr:LytR family transcriptional regulator [Ignavibacteria bacterium]